MEIRKINFQADTAALPIGRLAVLKITLSSLVKKANLLIKALFVNLFVILKMVFSKIISFPPNIIAKLRPTRDEEKPPLQKDQSKKGNKFKKFILLFLAFFVLTAIFVLKVKNFQPPLKSNSPDSRVEIKPAQKDLQINKEFQFPLKDAKGKEISKIKYVVERAELRDEIIVKGQKATAVKGRIFLILYIKITNESIFKIDTMNSKDYVRLSVNGNENEWLAADIHNDPVTIQPQSTKATRLGFPINESDTKLVLRVGEINGDKERIELNF